MWLFLGYLYNYFYFFTEVGACLRKVHGGYCPTLAASVIFSKTPSATAYVYNVSFIKLTCWILHTEFEVCLLFYDVLWQSLVFSSNKV